MIIRKASTFRKNSQDLLSVSSICFSRFSNRNRNEIVCRSYATWMTPNISAAASWYLFPVKSIYCFANISGHNQQQHHQQIRKKSSQHHQQQQQQQQQIVSGGDGPRMSVLMELTDRVGILHDVLKYFWKYDVNITRIESRPSKETSDKETNTVTRRFDFFVDLDGQRDDPSIQKLLQDLRPMTNRLLVLDEKEVHWFPRHISELDLIANRILDAGKDLDSDHPGFHDPTYRSRRAQLAQDAREYRWDQPIPRMDYTEEEIETWRTVWDRMEPFHDKYACKEYKVCVTCIKNKDTFSFHQFFLTRTPFSLFFFQQF